ncbi:uncharacterized protein LOC124818548 isoform X1 [Hydra vulgaris]|uniref:uncharacterized protein LOC124818548 isoform X1 n=2 Tax=Hydra vulgaris TaxID=6087 RepID=UPI001F5F7AFA|nr:uncharacterized protein LOC124818548 isoform X2 [Hydra vulgaris]XP_047145498.1 uncharacterized protein LOC124818548 isoform X2 [Hydra vulgaris]
MTEYLQNSPQHKKWLKKRKYTSIAFAIQSLILGIEYSVTLSTLWLYIKELVNTKSPKLFYTLVSVMYILSFTLSTPIIGRIVDRTRQVRVWFFICNCFLIAGNLLYSLQFSPWFLVVGRFLSGCCGLVSVMCAEIIRSYPSSETSFQLSIQSLAFNSGFIVGPCINFLFLKIDFYIGCWHLKNVNFIGIFMTIVCLIMCLLSFLMVHNLSKEFDLKGIEEKKDESVGSINIELIRESPVSLTNTEVISDINNESNENLPLLNSTKLQIRNEAPSSLTHLSIFKILKLLFTSFDTCLLLVCTFFILLFLVTFDMWFPLFVIDTLKLSLLELNICIFGTGISSVLILLIFICKPISEEKMFIVVMIGLFGICIINVSYIVLKYFNTKTLQLIFGIAYMINFAGAGIIPEVFIANTLAKYVSSNNQAFADGIRNSMFAAGTLTAFSSAAFTFEYLSLFSSTFIVLTLLLMVLLMARRKHLLNPKPIF